MARLVAPLWQDGAKVPAQTYPRFSGPSEIRGFPYKIDGIFIHKSIAPGMVIAIMFLRFAKGNQ
jgi:hypothetical protein